MILNYENYLLFEAVIQLDPSEFKISCLSLMKACRLRNYSLVYTKESVELY